MDYDKLKAEVESDPLARGYSGMTDAEVAAEINFVYRSQDREAVATWEIFEAIVPGEYAVLSADEKSLLGRILAMGTINVKGANTRAALAAMFGAGTTTRGNLQALQTETISRAAELGLGVVKAGHVEEVRRAG